MVDTLRQLLSLFHRESHNNNEVSKVKCNDSVIDVVKGLFQPLTLFTEQVGPDSPKSSDDRGCVSVAVTSKVGCLACDHALTSQELFQVPVLRIWAGRQGNEADASWTKTPTECGEKKQIVNGTMAPNKSMETHEVIWVPGARVVMKTVATT